MLFVAILGIAYLPDALAANDPPEIVLPDPGRQPTVEDVCSITGVTFASCPKATLNFHSVLLAVHGWNGSCASTFGTPPNTLFNVLSDKQFYDVDCFAYDSLKTPIAKNAQFLRQRILALKAKGYSEFLLVTHSLGGIVTLQMLTDVLLTPDGKVGNYQPWWTAPTPVQIVGLHAWAAPIYGLTNAVDFAGVIAQWVHYSPQSLGDIGANSPYLLALRKNLANLQTQYSSATPLWAERLGTPFYFYQGQSNDLVVASIYPDQALAEGWFGPKPYREPVATSTFHTDNVGKPGMPEFLGWPAEMVSDKALLELHVQPRYDEVFAPMDTIPATVAQRQETVVNGLLYYASQGKFPEAFEPSIPFFKQIFQESFTRSAQVDTNLVTGLSDEVTKHAVPIGNSEYDDSVVGFFVKFFSDVLDGYDPAGGENIKRLGYQHSPIVADVLNMTTTIFDSVNKYVKGPPDRSGVLKPGYASLADFDTRVNAVIASYLGSSNGPVVGLALTQIATVVAASPSDAVAKSGIVTAMNSYYGQNFSKLNAENKKSIAAFYLDIVARSDLARNETLTALNKTVTNAGRQVPLWATLRDDVTIGALANAVPVQSSATSDLTFLAQVAARAGASGNNSALARQATDKIASMKEIGAFTPEGRVVLRNAANGATLPTVANRLDAILRPSTE